MLKLFDYLPSQNGYKVRLLLNHLDLPYELVDVDIFEGECTRPEFLAKNPNGRIPVLQVEDGRFLSESNAILGYLAEGTRYLPNDRFERAQVQQWLFFEQYDHEPSIAVLRFWTLNGMLEIKGSQVTEKRAQGYEALEVMEHTLSRQPFLVGDHYTIADIALYAYTHVAHQAGFNLDRFPAIRSWIERVRTQPGYIEGVYEYTKSRLNLKPT